jgi:putative copper export protein
MGLSDVALALSRTTYLAGALSLAGALAFRIVVAPFPLTRVTWPSLVVALIGGTVWLVLQSGALAGTSDIADMLTAVPKVVQKTWFGNVFVVRLVPLLVAGGLAGFGASPLRLALAFICGAVAVALQVALGHAYASGNPLLMAALTLHVLAVSAWLGGLLPLWLALGIAATSGGRSPTPGQVARKFSLWGVLAVAAIVASGLEQATVLIGSWSGLFGTTFGRVALVKIGLLLMLICVALINRFVFTPALDRAPTRQHRLHISVVLEIALGLCVISAAAVLASQVPPTDAQMATPSTADGS